MAILVGIDPSLSSTGVCVRDTETGETSATQIDGHFKDCHTGARCRKIAVAAVNAISKSGLVRTCDTIHAFTEDPKGPLSGWAQDLPVLHWAIIRELEDEEFLYEHIYPVPSATLKKFLCNRGNAKPEDKVVSVLDKYRHLIPDQYLVSPETKGGMMAFKDLYDAVGLTALGDCYLGGDGYTKAQYEAVKKIKKL